MLLPPLVSETNKELLLILIRNQYEDNKIIFTTLLLLLSVASVYAQGRKISGKILSPLNKPIEGAIISAVGSKDAKTGVDGTFKMELKENTTQISVWAAGYYPETRLVDDNSQVVILMMPESTYKYNESAVLPMRIESSRPELTSAVNINKKISRREV